MKQAFQSVFAWTVPAVVALALGGLGERAWAAHRARAALRQTEETWRTLAASRPAPTAAATAALDAGLADAAEVLRELRSATARHRDALADLDRAAVPASAADAFFDLARFGERMRSCARQHHVELAPEERFGFAAYAHAGPAAPAIPGIFRQRLLIEHLLEVVFAAEPRDLLLVDRPPVAGEPTTAPGATEARLFRVGFTGGTAVLRSLLNALATSELPWVVRTIEAGPATAQRNSGQATPGGSEILVARELSRFVVSVECVPLPPVASEL